MDKKGKNMKALENKERKKHTFVYSHQFQEKWILNRTVQDISSMVVLHKTCMLEEIKVLCLYMSPYKFISSDLSSPHCSHVSFFCLVVHEVKGKLLSFLKLKLQSVMRRMVLVWELNPTAQQE